jgi:hypothetical protein
MRSSSGPLCLGGMQCECAALGAVPPFLPSVHASAKSRCVKKEAEQRRQPSKRWLARLTLREIRPGRRHCPRRPIHQPADHPRHPVTILPSQHLQHTPTQLARRGDKPNPLRERVHNMSSAIPTRAAAPIP